MIKLVEVMNTKYFYDSWSYALDKYFSTSGITSIDIAGAVFTPESMVVLRSYLDKIKVTDSQDILRKRLLDKSYDADEISERFKLMAEPFPSIEHNQNITSYIREFELMKVYTYNVEFDEEENIAIITLLTLARPKIRIFLSMGFKDLFSYVNYSLGYNNLRELLKSEIEFLYIWEKVPEFILLDGNEPYYLPGLGTFSETELLTECIILPNSFGHVRLVDHPNWSGVITKCFDVLKPRFDRINFTMKKFIDN